MLTSSKRNRNWWNVGNNKNEAFVKEEQRRNVQQEMQMRFAKIVSGAEIKVSEFTRTKYFYVV